MKRSMTPKEKAAWTHAYCQPHEVSFWGETFSVTPVLIPIIFGDGLKPIHLTPLATRPEYYILAGHSEWELDNGWREIEETILQAIEGEYGNSEDEQDNEESDSDHQTRLEWPALNTSCGYSRGEMLPKPPPVNPANPAILSKP